SGSVHATCGRRRGRRHPGGASAAGRAHADAWPRQPAGLCADRVVFPAAQTAVAAQPGAARADGIGAGAAVYALADEAPLAVPVRTRPGFCADGAGDTHRARWSAGGPRPAVGPGAFAAEQQSAVAQPVPRCRRRSRCRAAYLADAYGVRERAVGGAGAMAAGLRRAALGAFQRRAWWCRPGPADPAAGPARHLAAASWTVAGTRLLACAGIERGSQRGDAVADGAGADGSVAPLGRSSWLSGAARACSLNQSSNARGAGRIASFR